MWCLPEWREIAVFLDIHSRNAENFLMSESSHKNAPGTFSFKSVGKALGVVGALVAAHEIGRYQGTAEEQRSAEQVGIVQKSINQTLSERVAHLSDESVDVQMSTPERMLLINDYSKLQQQYTADQE
ncbi:hypothetical protein A2706_01630 [Candidatus Peribacteria bacterium RIFCSPHIGHO2_01_FULL_51_35]|nr:MAG: hypothetical protein A2706_01630 [Candidatus Peribacteria bacterium RIFCSPHIGHO2_01_FULL_51_35]